MGEGVYELDTSLVKLVHFFGRVLSCALSSLFFDNDRRQHISICYRYKSKINDIQYSLQFIFINCYPRESLCYRY